MKLKILSLFTFICITICSCKKTEKTIYFSEIKQDNINVFDIKKTKYFYEGNSIFSINVYLSAPYDFIKHNFIVFNNSILYEISLYDNCQESYKKNNFKLQPLIDKSENYNECDISLYPILDFSLRKNDTLRLYKNKWIVLKESFFDIHLKDTLYKFERQWHSIHNTAIILATKKRGILGTYQINKWNNKLDTSNITGYTLIQEIKPLNKKDIRFPKINLDNVQIFQK
jgi:hypothetical protein